MKRQSGPLDEGMASFLDGPPRHGGTRHTHRPGRPRRPGGGSTHLAAQADDFASSSTCSGPAAARGAGYDAPCAGPGAGSCKVCDPCRNTSAALRAVGFSKLEVTEDTFRHSVFTPINTAIRDIAAK